MLQMLQILQVLMLNVKVNININRLTLKIIPTQFNHTLANQKNSGLPIASADALVAGCYDVAVYLQQCKRLGKRHFQHMKI